MKNNRNKAATVVIGPEACLPVIEDIHRALVEQLSTHSIEVDAGQVREVDLSFVQLILVAAASAKSEGKKVSFAPPANEAVRDVLKRGGFLGDAAARRFWLGEAA